MRLRLSALEGASPSTEIAKVGFPYLGGIPSEHLPHTERGRETRRAGTHGAGAADPSRSHGQPPRGRWLFFSVFYRSCVLGTRRRYSRRDAEVVC